MADLGFLHLIKFINLINYESTELLDIYSNIDLNNIKNQILNTKHDGNGKFKKLHVYWNAHRFTTVILERSITLTRHLTAMENPPRVSRGENVTGTWSKLSEKN